MNRKQQKQLRKKLYQLNDKLVSWNLNRENFHDRSNDQMQQLMYQFNQLEIELKKYER